MPDQNAPEFLPCPMCQGTGHALKMPALVYSVSMLRGVQIAWQGSPDLDEARIHVERAIGWLKSANTLERNRNLSE